MNKKQKILIILGLTLALVSVLLVSNQVWAQGAASTTQSNIDSAGTRISGIGDSVLDMIFGFINQVFGSIGGTLYALAGGLANFSISLNFDILNNPMITTGWQITRDLANLGFVLFIIIIAIATILRMQQYGAKSTLGKLIAVALLVNFSLVFAGVFIDFSNMLTNFFIKNITSSGPGGLAVALSESFKIQNLLQVRGGEEANLFQGMMQAGGSMFTGIASNIFVIALTLIGAFSLFALAVMFLVRVVALGLLLVLVPLACLSAILPATKKLWGQWSSSFMEWTLFGPMASFFLYLAVFMATNYGKLMEQQALTAQGVGTRNEIAFVNLLIAQPLVQIGRMFLVIGFLLGGLIAANSMKTMGASTVMSGVNAFGKWARGAIGKGAAGGAQRTFMSGVRRDATTGEVTTRGQRMAAAISRVPGFRGVAQRISAFSSPQAKAEEVEQYRKQNLVHLSNEALIRQMSAPGAFVNRTAAASMIQDAARRNLTGDARIAPVLNRYLETAQGMGNINTVLNNRPDLAPILDRTRPPADVIQRVMQRIRADKADEISHDALQHVEVLLALDNSKLRRLGTVGEQRQKDAVENAINLAITNIATLTPQQQVKLNDIEARVRTLQAGGNW